MKIIVAVFVMTAVAGCGPAAPITRADAEANYVAHLATVDLGSDLEEWSDEGLVNVGWSSCQAQQELFDEGYSVKVYLTYLGEQFPPRTHVGIVQMVRIAREHLCPELKEWGDDY